jgi:hypothetical protein
MKDIRRRDEVVAAVAVGMTLVGRALTVASDAARKAAEAFEAAAQELVKDEPAPPPTAPPTPPGEYEDTGTSHIPPDDQDMPFNPELPPEGTGPYDQPTRGPYDPPAEPPQNP